MTMVALMEASMSKDASASSLEKAGSELKPYIKEPVPGALGWMPSLSI